MSEAVVVIAVAMERLRRRSIEQEKDRQEIENNHIFSSNNIRPLKIIIYKYLDIHEKKNNNYFGIISFINY